MIQVNRYTLANGLRIVHNEDDSTQMVALNLSYDVGARDEDPSHTGFAHLFEHLMFGGSLHIPDYDTPVQNAGGENNAWTNNDITNYYITLPHQNVETGFWLESDRMFSLDFSPKSLEVQRQVVIEEFKQRNLNQPYGDASHLLRELAYESHPYRWPTIGKEIAHIAQATLEEVKDFFYRFYAPNNAILAVTGHIPFEETVRLAEKWFGPIPARKIPPRKLPAEKPQTAVRRRTVERKVPVDAIYMAFHMSNRMHPDYYVYDMITDILSNGRSSRFIQSLVQEQKLFTSIDAYISGSLDEGLLHVTGKPVEGVSLEQADEKPVEQLLLGERFLLQGVENTPRPGQGPLLLTKAQQPLPVQIQQEPSRLGPVDAHVEQVKSDQVEALKPLEGLALPFVNVAQNPPVHDIPHLPQPGEGQHRLHQTASLLNSVCAAQRRQGLIVFPAAPQGRQEPDDTHQARDHTHQRQQGAQ